MQCTEGDCDESAPVAAVGPRPLAELATLDDYIISYGKTLARKAIESLNPLHVPERDAAPDFSEIVEFNPKRKPFDAQGHVIAATTKMLTERGSGFLVGEMGVGKTMLGMLAVHKHAAGKPYRAIVLCPDHLIAVWTEELKETIPGVQVRSFENWKGIIDLFAAGNEVIKEVPGTPRSAGPVECDISTGPDTFETVFAAPKESSGKVRKRVKSWSPPTGPEWILVGRNQAKWLPDWLGIGEVQRRFNGESHAGHSHRTIVTKTEPVVDDMNRPVTDAFGRQKMRSVTAKVHICPSCGGIARTKKGIPMSAAEIAKEKRQCDSMYLVEVPDPDKRKNGLDRSPSHGLANLHAGKEVVHRGKKYRAKECGEQLWNFTNRPYRWAPARIIQKKLRGMFSYLIVDEVHEQKSDESAQSLAAGKLMSSVDHVLALTGTLIGGYACHLFPLMMRMTPKSIIGEGFTWRKTMDFSWAYGRVDRIVTTKSDADDSGPSVGKRVVSMRKAKGGKSTERQRVAPGVMPNLYGRHLLGTSLFITLEELAEELPDLDEFVEAGGCDMPPDVREEYKRIEQELVAANTELVKKGSLKLCGAMLATLLDYPDRPYGWGHDPEFLKAIKQAVADGMLGAAAAALEAKQGTVGYWLVPNNRKATNWYGVVTPQDRGGGAISPKERKLIDLCVAEKAEGRQVWVYVQMTGKRNIRPRLKMLLEQAGLKVGILDSSAVKPVDRKEWIDKVGPTVDVMISHPKPVSTGLTFFSKRDGGHNFSTLIFFQTGYSLFDMRQAARRAWRIGQPLGCKVYYLFYKETMQHRAMLLMSKKMDASLNLEGEFSSEGLAAMAGSDNAQMALARTLSEGMEDTDMQRSWSKVKGGSKKSKQVIVEMAKATPEQVESEKAANAAALITMTAHEVAAERLALPSPEAAAAVEAERARSLASKLHEAMPAPKLKLVCPEAKPAPAPAAAPDEVTVTWDDVPDISTFGSKRPKSTMQLVTAPEPEPEDDDDDDSWRAMLTPELIALMFKRLQEAGMA